MAERNLVTKEGLQPHSPAPDDGAGEAFRIEKVNVTVTLVSEAGRQTSLTLTGTGGTLPANGIPGRLEVESFEETELLRIRHGTPLHEVEDAYIRLVMHQTGNHQKRAAKLLGISPHTLSNRLRHRGGRKGKSSAEGA